MTKISPLVAALVAAFKVDPKRVGKAVHYCAVALGYITLAIGFLQDAVIPLLKTAAEVLRQVLIGLGAQEGVGR